MTDSKNLDKKTVAQLEELLTNQKQLVKNVIFLGKLPDKGAKLKTSIVVLEKELEKRKMEVHPPAQPLLDMPTKLEWVNSSGAVKLLKKTENLPKELDSDDDSEGEANDGTNEVKDDKEYGDGINALRLIATSQISQNQPKTIILPPKHSPGELSTKLKNLELHEAEKKFKPHQFLISTKSSPSSSPVNKSKPSSPSNTAAAAASSTCKYFECLESDKRMEFSPIKYLSYDESLKCEEDYQNKYDEAHKSEQSQPGLPSDKESGKFYAMGHSIKKVTFQKEAIDKDYVKALLDVKDNDVDVLNEDAASEISEDSSSQADSDDD